jgi:hypothetical protein
MPKEDDNKVEDEVVDPVVDESTTEPGSEDEDLQVELDKHTDIEGDLVTNPTLDEETESEDETTGTEEEPETGEEAEPEATEEPVVDEPEITPEKDETGVYAPRTAVDPGDFQPKGDYGFEVTTADGKTVKINTPEEADAFAQRLDSEENLLTAYQFTQFNRNVLRMDSGIDREKAQYDNDKETFELQYRQEQVRNEQVKNWSNEINYLEAKGLVPKITPELNASNWTDPKTAEEPAVKERLAIFQYMEKENNDRRAAGIAELTSAVDAYRLMQAEEQGSAEKVENKREMAERRARGKMVSGNSSFTPSNEQSNSIIGEGGNLNDLVHEFSASQ